MEVIFLTVHWKKLRSGNQRAGMEWKIISRLAESFADEKDAEVSTLGWKMISIFTLNFHL